MPTEFSFEEATQPAKSFTFEEATAPKSFSFEEAQTTTATTPQPSPLAQGINEQNKTAFETYTKAMEMLGTGLASQRISHQRESAKMEQELSIQPVGTGSEPLTIGTPTQSKEESLVPTAREFAAWATMPLIPLEGAGQVATRLGQDIVSKIMGDPQYGGNLRAWIENPDQQSPAEKFIADAAKSSPHMAVLANLGKQASEMSPMLGIGAAPGLAGRAVSAGFASTMGLSLYDAAKELNRQLGLPADQQNAGLIAELKATLVTTGVFGALASTHAATGRSPIDLAKSGFEAMKPEITPKPSPSVSYRRPGQGTPFPKAGESRPEPQAIEQPTVMPFSATPPTTTPPEQRVTDETVFNEALARQQALQAEINAKTLAPLTTAETSKTEVPNAETIRRNQGQLPPTGEIAQGSETPRSDDLQQVAPGQPESVGARETLAPQTEKAVKEIVQPEDVSGSVLGKPTEATSPQVQTEEAAQSPPPPPAQPVGTEAGKAVESSPELPPKNPIRFLRKGENMNDFLKRATDDELLQMQREGDEYAKWLNDERDYRRQTKDETWRDLNPIIADANHMSSVANWELLRRSVEKQSQAKSETAVSPTPEPPASQKPAPPAPTSEGKGKINYQNYQQEIRDAAAKAKTTPENEARFLKKWQPILAREIVSGKIPESALESPIIEVVQTTVLKGSGESTTSHPMVTIRENGKNVWRGTANEYGYAKPLEVIYSDRLIPVTRQRGSTIYSLKQEAKPTPPPTAGAGEKPIGMGGAVPEEFTTSPQTPTGIKNAQVDIERGKRGLPPAIQPARRSFGKVWDEAMAKIDADPGYPDRLINELRDKPRALTDLEDATLLHRQIDLQNEYGKATRDLAQAFDDGRTADVDELKVRVAEWSDKLLDIYNVGKKVGTETGRGLAARKMMAYEDFSLAQMELAKRSAKGGGQLTDTERAEITKLHEKIADLQKRYDDLVAANKAKATVPGVDEAIDEAKAGQKRDKATGKTRTPTDIKGVAGRIRAKLKESENSEITSDLQKIVRQMVEENPKITRDQLVDQVNELFPEWSRRDTMDAISGYGDFKPLKKDEISVIVRDLKGQLQQIGKLEDMAAGQAPRKTGLERRTPTDEERRLIKQVEEAKRRGGYKVTDPATQLRTRLQAAKTAIQNQIKDLEFEIAKKERILKVKTQMVPDKELLDLRAKRESLKAEHKAIFGERVISDAQKIKMAEAALDRQIKDIEEQLRTGEIFPPGKKPPSTLTSPGIEAKLQTLAELKLRRYYERERIQPGVVPEIQEANKLAAALKSVKTRLENQIAELDNALKKRQQIVKTKTALVYDDAANALKARRDELKKQYDEIFPRPELTDAQRLERWKTRTTNRIQVLQERLANRDFAKRTQRPPPPLDAAAMDLQAQLFKAKQDFQRGLLEDRLAQRPMFEKAQDTFLRWYRGGILSSPVVFGKLTAAAVMRAGLTPAEEAVGVGVSRAFPELAKRAPREGYWNSRAEANAIVKGLTRGVPDAWSILKTGESQLDVLYGKGREGAVGESQVRPFSIADLPGRTHGAWKATTKRAEFERAYEKIMAWYGRNGADTSNSGIQLQAAVEAYKHAQRSIFLQDNRLVSAFNSAINRLQQAEKSTGRTPVGGKLAATTARVLLPIVRVPSNIVAETFQFAFGSVTGPSRLIKAYAQGIEKLPPEQADLIMREIKKGSIGGVGLLLGYFMPQIWGGLYVPGEKQKSGQPKPGEAMLNGEIIPKWSLHHPFWETVQTGSTISRIMDDPKGGISKAASASILGLAEMNPLVKEMADVHKLFDPKQQTRYAAETLRSIIVPQGVQWAAKTFDTDVYGNKIERKPKDFIQHLNMGVPGLRETVPEMIGTPSSKKKR